MLLLVCDYAILLYIIIRLTAAEEISGKMRTSQYYYFYYNDVA